MSSRFSNVRPFRGRQQRALDSTTAPVPDEDINQLVERGDPVRQLPALKLLPRLHAGGPIETPTLSHQNKEYLTRQLRAFKDGSRRCSSSRSRIALRWMASTFLRTTTPAAASRGCVSRAAADDHSVIRARKTRVVAYDSGRWCGAYIFDGTDGASGYGGREMSSIPHKPLLTPASASRSQARTPAASSTSILSRASAVRTSSRTSGSREAFQREQRPARHGLLGRLWIIEYTRASAFVFGSVGSLRMAPYCSSVVSRPAFTRNGLKFGLSAGQSANCLLEGRAVQI